MDNYLNSSINNSNRKAAEKYNLNYTFQAWSNCNKRL
jgi:hypothetical protein